MDLQGKPIGITGEGTKNTSTPADPIQEGPGAVAKDSLAAESSAFSDKDTSGVSGSSSTFNNTNTSGATELPSAGSATDRLSTQDRDDAPGTSGRKYPEAAGQYDVKGTHSDEGYSGAPSADRTTTSGSGVYNTGLGSSGGSGSGGLKNADPAPTYASINLQDTKPKGNNIQEGGFDADAPNASFTTEIGTDKDPGRQGLLDQQLRSSGDAAGAGLPKTQQGGEESRHQYGSLKSDEAA